MLPRNLLTKSSIYSAAAAWFLLVIAGFAVLVKFSTTPGPNITVPVTMPECVPVALDHKHFNLLVFMHPHCPCSAATIGELARVAARCGDRLVISVFFYTDRAQVFGDEWARSELWDAAAAIKNIYIQSDDRGAVAEMFSVQTSGHAILYNSRGELVFHGGITSARGHSGDNRGVDAIYQSVFNNNEMLQITPAFGCPILSKTE
ncbi:MAG: hypothetical protein ACKVS6_09805 [Planctomycetota bacterium]